MTDQDRSQWTKLVADFEASDLTQREFASERGISFCNLRNWIYRIRELEGYNATEVAPLLSVIEVMDDDPDEVSTSPYDGLCLTRRDAEPFGFETLSPRPTDCGRIPRSLDHL